MTLMSPLSVGTGTCNRASPRRQAHSSECLDVNSRAVVYGDRLGPSALQCSLVRALPTHRPVSRKLAPRRSHSRDSLIDHREHLECPSVEHLIVLKSILQF